MKSTMLVGISFDHAVLVVVVARAVHRRRLDGVLDAVQDHAAGSRHLGSSAGRHQVRVGRLQAHLGVERAHQELADRDGSAMVEERPHAQVRVDALHLGRVDAAIGGGGDAAVEDPLAEEVARDGAVALVGLRDRLRADRAQLGRDLVGQHLLQAEAEQVRSVTAVGPRGHVAADAGRAPRPSVAGRAAVRQPGADDQRVVDVPRAVAFERALSLDPRELPLEYLPAPADRARGIAADDEERRVRHHHAASARPDLFVVRLRDAFVRGVRSQVTVHELRERRRSHQERHGDRHRDSPRPLLSHGQHLRFLDDGWTSGGKVVVQGGM